MPPQLDKAALIDRVAASRTDIPEEITKVVVEIIVESLAEALSQGREVSLRGFGRLIPRRYSNSPSKRLGLLFHPSPVLAELCDRPPPPAAPDQEG